MTQGDIDRTGVDFLVVDGLSKTNTAITKGQLVIFDTDGWGPGAAASTGPWGVLISATVAAVVATQHDIQVCVRGNVRVQKKAGAALNQGAYAKTEDGGEVSAAGTNAVAMCTKDAASADTEAQILL